MSVISIPLVKYVLAAAIRDKLVLSLAILIVLGTSLSIFLGSGAATEAVQFSIVFTAGTLRIISVLGLALFIVFHVRRSFDTKDVEYLLTRPLNRSSFVLSHAISFSILSAFFGILITGVVMALGSKFLHEGFYLWGYSLILELIIVANISLFFAMVIPNASASALSVFGLYVLARLIGQLLGISDSTIVHGEVYNTLGYVMDAVSLVVPRIDLMTQTSWLIYGADASVGYLFLTLQCLLYSTLLLFAALFDLIRREF